MTDQPTSRDRPDPTSRVGNVPTTTRNAADRSGDHADPRWLVVALPVAVWTLTAVVTFLALSGQVEFAEWAGITDGRKYLVPAGLELSAVGFLLVGYRRARRGFSPLGMWALAAAVGGFAVWTNVVHAGDRAGPIFGAFTVVALLLWFVKFRDDYAKHQQDTGQATGRRPKFGWRMWATAPRLTCRSWLIATRLQVSEVSTAVMYAELWRAVHRGKATTGRSPRERRAAAWRQVMVAADHPVADIPTVAEVTTVQLIDRPVPEPSTTDPTSEPDQSQPESTTTDRPRRPRKSTTRREDRPLRMVWSPTVVANARAIRHRYGDSLPPGKTDRQVRDEMGWSHYRAKPALDAYRAGADRESTDQPSSDDDKERESWTA